MNKAFQPVTPQNVPLIRTSVGIGDYDPVITNAESLVIAANQDFYRQIAQKYEQYESCAFAPYLQQILDKDLDAIHSFSVSFGRTPHCLDCGGGTGNLALKMLARGWNLTVVDISSEMLSVLKEKAQTRGYAPRLVHDSIERFLAETDETYDLVAFSSVFHHLFSYASTARLAASVVRPGGFFYSNYDPVIPKNPLWTRVSESVDIAFAKIALDPADLFPGVGRRLLKILSPRDPLFHRALVSAGDLAEFHAHSGVDDAEIVRLLRASGFTILDHSRYPAGRTRALRWFNSKFPLLQNFKIIARRDPALSENEKASPSVALKQVADPSIRGNGRGSSANNDANAWTDKTPPRKEELVWTHERNTLGNLQGASALPKRSLWKNLTSKWDYLMAQEALRRAPFVTLSRLLSWRVRCLLRRPGVAFMQKWNVRMFLPPNWRGVEKLIFAFREEYEPELAYIQQILPPGKTFVDAGACYGIYTLAASKSLGEEGRVLAFEPASRAFRVLQKNIDINSFKNVLAYPLALTEKEGKTWLYHHPNVGCDSLGRDHSFTESAEEIATDSLDNVLRQVSIEHVDVIKMDVQGAEELVLRGATNTLRTCHPVVIFEVYPEGPVALGLSPYGAWELLDNFGYEFFVVDPSGALRKVESPSDNRNVVAIYRQ